MNADPDERDVVALRLWRGERSIVVSIASALIADTDYDLWAAVRVVAEEKWREAYP